MKKKIKTLLKKNIKFNFLSPLNLLNKVIKYNPSKLRVGEIYIEELKPLGEYV